MDVGRHEVEIDAAPRYSWPWTSWLWCRSILGSVCRSMSLHAAQEALDVLRPFDTRLPTTRNRRVPSWAADGLSG